MSLLLFALLTYGLVFLLADARIFGCDAKEWNKALALQEDCLEIGDQKLLECQEKGILKWRQRLLRHSFFSDLLGCYYCTGWWVGPVAYWLLLGAGMQFTYVPDTIFQAVVSTVVAAPLGGVSAYVIDTIVLRLEKGLE
jgi:hypothetical protein